MKNLLMPTYFLIEVVQDNPQGEAWCRFHQAYIESIVVSTYSVQWVGGYFDELHIDYLLAGAQMCTWIIIIQRVIFAILIRIYRWESTLSNYRIKKIFDLKNLRRKYPLN